MKKCCDMKGFLSFLVLRMILKRQMSGEKIREELNKRKGTRPSPGTIYPVLKTLSDNGWIKEASDHGKEKKYEITPRGKKELEIATKKFISLFCDMHEEFSATDKV